MYEFTQRNILLTTVSLLFSSYIRDLISKELKYAKKTTVWWQIHFIMYALDKSIKNKERQAIQRIWMSVIVFLFLKNSLDLKRILIIYNNAYSSLL